jgi:Uma2 family endonuclease
MSTRMLVSEEEYLHTSYEPDCDYVDGELVERNVGTPAHSLTQSLLILYFGRKRKLWGILVYPEVRFRIRKGKYLVPDIAIVAGEKEIGDVLTAPPLIWIEILSPEDRPIRVNRKVREVLEFGVPYVWVVDPETLESELHTPQGSSILADGILRIPNTPIEVPLHALDED